MIKPTNPIGYQKLTINDVETDAYILKSPIHGRGLRVLVSIENGWEHVSVCALLNRDKRKTPVWPEMCFVKQTFWEASECVMQLHVPEEDYVNFHENILHLWRPIGIEIPQPDKLVPDGR